MKNSTINSYNELIKFNKIIEYNCIEYVAVAGTVLGLNRHGGIIPWDNDIDLGFTKENWDKLFNISDILRDNNMKYSSKGINHGNFGYIDVFLLNETDTMWMEGDAKTYCHVDEYKTIKKQIFGPTYIYAPICSIKSLKYRYCETYFYEGDVNDNFHYRNNKIKRFYLDHRDRSYQYVINVTNGIKTINMPF